MAILARRDAIRWHGLAGRVGLVLEPRLGSEVMANRSRHGPGGWRPAELGHALRQARGAARGVGAPLLLRSDVEAFYTSVTPSVLVACLVRVGVEVPDAMLAAGLLDGWGSEGYAGLPIGPPGSAVLANAVLGAADDALRPLPFVRWVDDYLIGCRNEAEAASALDRLDEALASLGLIRSRGKTELEERPMHLRWLATASPTGPDGRPALCR
jgi:Reverse transcriptase (RNA-dependent DNA polymerase)